MRAPILTIWIVLFAAGLGACQSATRDTRPCGVIRDSLKTVRGATPADTRRIDVHFERGRAAGCW